MLYRVNLQPGLGFALTSKPAGAPGPVQVTSSHFVASRAGDPFVRFSESVGKWIWKALPIDAPRPEKVSNFLAIIHRDWSAEIHVNDVALEFSLLYRRDVKAGETICLHDVANVISVNVVGVEIPPTAGFVIFFTLGWRRGLGFDLAPVSGLDRTYDVHARLAQLYGTVMWDELANLDDAHWEAMLQARWFPFSVLRPETINRIVRQIAAGAPLEPLLDPIEAELRSSLPAMARAISASGTETAKRHGPFLDSAVERFLARDWIASVSILMPRIEGALRLVRSDAGLPATGKYDALISSGVQKNQEAPGAGWLLPDRFAEYLRKVVFATFDPNTGAATADASRHSVGHGVASAIRFDREKAMIVIMSFVQLLWLQV